MVLLRQKVAVCATARPLDHLLAFEQVGIEAVRPSIGAHEGGWQLALRKTLQEAGLTQLGRCYRPQSVGSCVFVVAEDTLIG